MSKSSGLKNAPSKTGNPSGKGRANAAPKSGHGGGNAVSKDSSGRGNGSKGK